MTTLLAKVLAQVSQLPEGEQDAVAARLLQTLAQFGSAKGLGDMAEDFEEPMLW